MATHEVDLIGQAIADTEKEIFGEAFKPDQEPVLDETGDRSMEDMGDGLEGQHEPPDDEFESEDEESEDEEETADDEDGDDAEAEDEDGEDAEDDDATDAAPAEKPAEKPEGRVPSGRLREQTERADKAEKALQALQAEREGERTSYRGEIDALRRQMQEVLTSVQQRPAQPTPPAAPEAPPDIFENPQGFVEWQNRQFEAKLSQRDQMLANMRVENSLAIAHAIHKDAYEKAFEAAQKLDIARNPEDRATAQRIYNSPNPGEALVQWHRRNEALRIVGDDPVKYKETVASEIREAMKNDPEFRKQILDDLRAEANGERPSKPARTITRLPKSLNGATGQSSHGRDNNDPTLYDDSDQAVFQSAWR